MNIHEYQAKSILKQFGVAIPEGIVINQPDEAVQAAKAIKEKTGMETWAVKAQIHAGGRGKGGGVKIAQSFDEVKKFAGEIIGM
ncbi:MAG TPA: ATP-grasp domain-containing protein, partial [Bacteroidales bacterium]|nr:ATP-grasp domain-containing protein [Bacteroidales bacterium]